MTIDPRILQIAEQACAPRQLQVWTLHVVHGMTFRGIATHLDLNRTGVTDAYDGACKKLRAHGIMVTPDGRPYLEKETA